MISIPHKIKQASVLSSFDLVAFIFTSTGELSLGFRKSVQEE
jgi:hypothetical protein